MIDTFPSFVAGYLVATSILAIYLITLWTRGRRANERLVDARRRERDVGATPSG